MRKKRFLSVVLSSALVATMAGPVMASNDTGTVTVPVGDVNPVLRVEVPTTLAVEVDQYEITEAGTQLASAEFDLKNRSEMAVEVSVNSQVTLDSAISLVPSVNAVKTSSANEAWLAVAARTSSTSFNDASANSIGKLTERNKNVAVFTSANEAKQTFWLTKGTGSATYKLLSGSDAADVKAYAQFYPLTSANSSISNDADLQTQVDSADVYYVASANEANDVAMTRIRRHSTVSDGTYISTNNYYTAGAQTDADTANAGKGTTKYVYGEAALGQVAGFRYIGKLSRHKDTWSSADIQRIVINYTIHGRSEDRYSEVSGNCVYGHYRDLLSISTNGIINIGVGPAEYQKLILSTKAGEAIEVNNEKGQWINGGWNVNANKLTFELSSDWKAYAKGKTVTVTLTLKDGSTYVAKADFPA